MSDWLHLSIQALVFILMLVGLFGLVIPIFPGLVVIWLAALGYGLATGFNWASGLVFAGMTLLMLFGSIVDNLLMNAKARQTGASWLALGAGLAAGIAGSLLLPPFGGLPASLLAVFAVEFARLRDWRRAFSSTRSMAVGCGLAFVIRFAIGGIILLAWAAWAFLPL